MKRKASGDEVFKAFDDKISSYLDKNRASIEQEYRQRAGKQVSDADVEAFISGLGDAIYDHLKLDPAHVSRFVDFYAGDEKLQKMISGFIDSSREYPRAASVPPGKISSELRRISDSIRPGMSISRSSISRSLREMHAALEGDSVEYVVIQLNASDNNGLTPKAAKKAESIVEGSFIAHGAKTVCWSSDILFVGIQPGATATVRSALASLIEGTSGGDAAALMAGSIITNPA
ncbi:MAG TPA: hypothetical protein VIE65_12545 [Methylobacter sp.]|jgi:hypothetical protein